MKKSGLSQQWRLLLVGAIALFLLIVASPMSYSQNSGDLPAVKMADLSLLAQTPTPQISPDSAVPDSTKIKEAT